MIVADPLGVVVAAAAEDDLRLGRDLHAPSIAPLLLAGGARRSRRACARRRRATLERRRLRRTCARGSSIARLRVRALPIVALARVAGRRAARARVGGQRRRGLARRDRWITLGATRRRRLRDVVRRTLGEREPLDRPRRCRRAPSRCLPPILLNRLVGHLRDFLVIAGLHGGGDRGRRRLREAVQLVELALRLGERAARLGENRWRPCRPSARTRDRARGAAARGAGGSRSRRRSPSLGDPIDRTRSTPPACGSRRSSTMRSIRARSARTRTSSSAALLTVSALCPALSRAVANRSRTNAVSSATMTVLVVATVDAVTQKVSDESIRCVRLVAEFIRFSL